MIVIVIIVLVLVLILPFTFINKVRDGGLSSAQSETAWCSRGCGSLGNFQERRPSCVCEQAESSGNDCHVHCLSVPLHEIHRRWCVARSSTRFFFLVGIPRLHRKASTHTIAP